MTFYVRVTGLPEVMRKLSTMGGTLPAASAAGLEAAAKVVEADAKLIVHSDTNPWAGSRDPNYQRPTGTLKRSIGSTNVERIPGGQQINIQVNPATRLSRDRPGGRRQGAANTLVYGPIEERHHPFMKPALWNNVQSVLTAFAFAFGNVIRRVW